MFIPITDPDSEEGFDFPFDEPSDEPATNEQEIDIYDVRFPSLDPSMWL